MKLKHHFNEPDSAYTPIDASVTHDLFHITWKYTEYVRGIFYQGTLIKVRRVLLIEGAL
jgi:hypothetical protein